MTNIIRFIFVVMAFVSMASTGLALGIKPPPRPSPTPAPTPRPTPAPTPRPTPTPAPSGFQAYWIGKHADAPNWTLHAQDAINKYGQSLIAGASDVTSFCPNYNRLVTRDKIDFWVQLLAAMTKYESGFNPASRYIETTMGTDPITAAQVASEGLLQLSYQDERNYKSVLPAGVCDFDFDRDRQYGLKDLRRSILDPKNNITCAVGILNRQVARKGLIAIGTGAYWSVIKTNSDHHRLAEIRAITKATGICR